MPTFTLEKNVAAPPSTVFEVLADHRNYSTINGRIRSSTLEREGDPAPNGVGAIRVLKSFGPPLREEVVEFVPGERLVYRLLSGAPLRDHVGTVTLTERTDGTNVTYRIDTTPTIPVIGRAAMPIVRTAVRQLFDGLAKESERRARA
jgi:uncharacterized protein YndB with AHSA1/START domain